MDGAPLARRFIFPERTAVQPRASIGQEGITRGASPRVSLLHPAVEVDHAPDGSLFPLNSGHFPHFFLYLCTANIRKVRLFTKE